MAPEQRAPLLAVLSEQLLPRIQMCATQALTHMPVASIQDNLQGLARCGAAHSATCFLHLHLDCTSLDQWTVL